jgi:hypothetical protein
MSAAPDANGNATTTMHHSSTEHEPSQPSISTKRTALYMGHSVLQSDELMLSSCLHVCCTRLAASRCHAHLELPARSSHCADVQSYAMDTMFCLILTFACSNTASHFSTQTEEEDTQVDRRHSGQ